MKKTKWLHLCEKIFLIAGVLALSFYGLARLYSYSYQKYAEYAFDEQLHQRSPSIVGFIEHLFGSKGTTAQKRQAGRRSSPKKPNVDGRELLRQMVFAPEMIPDPKSWDQARLRKYKKASAPPPRGSVIGRLEIPSLDLSVMLLQGTDSWTLNRAVGHIDGTALPGRPGNIGIAGHRDGFFRCLKDIKRNSIITLTTLKGRFTYRVSNIDIVKPKDIEVLQSTTNPTLTLVTCYPFHYVGDAPKRYIVSAEIIKAENPSELAAEFSGVRQPHPHK